VIEQYKMLILSIDVGIKNLAFCIYDSDACAIKFWKVFSLTPINNDMARGIVKDVDDLNIDLLPIERIVIEMQPGRNKRIKAIEHFLHMYFVMKDKRVTIFSAKHKLAGTGCENRGKTAQMYRERKKASIALCKQWLSEHEDSNTEWIGIFDKKGSKKDDLADSLSQALAFCHKIHPEESSRPTSISDDTEVRPRKPTAKQLQRGRLSRSNLKHFLVKEWKNEKDLISKLKKHAMCMKAVKQLYKGDAAACIAHLAAAPPPCASIEPSTN
jgi:hypothetical protein